MLFLHVGKKFAIHLSIMMLLAGVGILTSATPLSFGYVLGTIAVSTLYVFGATFTYQCLAKLYQHFTVGNKKEEHHPNKAVLEIGTSVLPETQVEKPVSLAIVAVPMPLEPPVGATIIALDTGIETPSEEFEPSEPEPELALEESLPLDSAAVEEDQPSPKIHLEPAVMPSVTMQEPNDLPEPFSEGGSDIESEIILATPPDPITPPRPKRPPFTALFELSYIREFQHLGSVPFRLPAKVVRRSARFLHNQP